MSRAAEWLRSLVRRPHLYEDFEGSLPPVRPNLLPLRLPASEKIFATLSPSPCPSNGRSLRELSEIVVMIVATMARLSGFQTDRLAEFSSILFHRRC